MEYFVFILIFSLSLFAEAFPVTTTTEVDKVDYYIRYLSEEDKFNARITVPFSDLKNAGFQEKISLIHKLAQNRLVVLRSFVQIKVSDLGQFQVFSDFDFLSSLVERRLIDGIDLIMDKKTENILIKQKIEFLYNIANRNQIPLTSVEQNACVGLF